MPLTKKGEEIMQAMKQQYGSEKGEQVFYASKNAGNITGVDQTLTPHCNYFDPYQLPTSGYEEK